MRALIVSTSWMLRAAWRDAARGAGLQVVEAECAEEARLAVSILGTQELALIDASLPKAPELVARLRDESECRVLVVAPPAASGPPEPDLPEADAFLQRPFTAAVLARQLEVLGLRGEDRP